MRKNTVTPQEEPVRAAETGIAAALARSDVYQWLSLGWRYPDRDVSRQLHATMRHQQVLTACRLLESLGDGSLVKVAEQAIRRLRRCDSEALEASYIRTFGHIVRSQLSLYETEYGDGQALRGVHELGDIAGFYHAFGLEVGRSAAERVDHASVECGFMHWLCYKEAYAIVHHGVQQRELCFAAQRRFLQEHLGWWLPSMARHVLKADAGTVYAALAGVVLAFLAAERKYFDLPAVSERLGLRTPEPSMEEGCQSCSMETACPGGPDALAVRSAPG